MSRKQHELKVGDRVRFTNEARARSFLRRTDGHVHVVQALADPDEANVQLEDGEIWDGKLFDRIEFGWARRDDESVDEARTRIIQEAIGAASVCWVESDGERIFDAELALEIAHQLKAALTDLAEPPRTSGVYRQASLQLAVATLSKCETWNTDMVVPLAAQYDLFLESGAAPGAVG